MKLIAALVVVVVALISGSISGCCTCECGGPSTRDSDPPDFPDAARASVRPELAPAFVAAAAR